MLLERECISQEVSGSQINLEELQESIDSETIVGTSSQLEFEKPIEPNDISLSL